MNSLFATLLDDVRALSPAEIRARYPLPPIAGGALDDPPDDDPDPSEDSPADDPPADDPADDLEDSNSDDPADDDKVTMTKAEAEALRRGRAEAEKQLRAKDRQIATAKAAEKKRQGEFEGLYQEEKTKREELEGTVKKRALKAAIRDIAGRLSFRNAGLIVDMFTAPGPRQLDADALVDEDLEVDEGSVEDALKALAKSDAYLVRVKTAQKDADLPGRRKARNGAPPSDDDKTSWNPAETMRSAYADNSS